jgi:hypothetical protein
MLVQSVSRLYLVQLQPQAQKVYVRIYLGFKNTCFQSTSLYTNPSSSTSGCLVVPEELLITGPVIKGLAGSSGGSRDLGSCGMGEVELGYEPPVIFGQILWMSLCCVG